MEKPTILFAIEPFILGSSTVQSFIGQTVSLAYKLEHQFGGVSVNLAGSAVISTIAEFRWKGSTVIKIRDTGSKDNIIVNCPFRIVDPSMFAWNSREFGDVCDLAFVDVINRQLKKLNDLKLNITNHRMSRLG